MAKTATITQIRLEQDDADTQVMAQSALIGERAVAWTRLALFIMMGIATELVSRAIGKPLPPSGVRAALVAVYLVMSVTALVALRRAKKTDPRRALVLPVFFSFADVGFFVGQSMIAVDLGSTPLPEVTTATMAVLICYSVARFRLMHVALSTALSIIGFVAISSFAGRERQLNWTLFICFSYVGLGILIGLTNHRIRKMFVEIRRRENLSRFLPRQVVDRVLESGGSTLHPVQREVTILFSDIRNFTAMSESMAPKEVLAFLDDYFGHMAQIVKGHDGMLNKFIGDGLLAVWGVPDLLDDHAERALKAAVDMRRKMIEINAIRAQEGKAVFKIGIGVHTGVVAAGMLGGADQREYTVIGDAVNLASRIEGLTKTLNTDILASDASWLQGGARFTGERVGEERVKGRDAAVVVYALRGPA